ncbi:hypothetical protein DPD11_12515 [Salmonella enterica subsp. salamae]|nr:hypothetical protein [Salmonella enterica]ECC9459649.1 hypothetical protein [Salmonella enterica subsp. salamae]ECI4071850.1 hypothetical protein [Salmonella enterica subsp. salamae]
MIYSKYLETIAEGTDVKQLSLKHSTGQTKPSNNGEDNIVTVKISREGKYILTVGFEVNYPEAFHNDVLNLSIDYGHAFFYVTRRPTVSKVDIVDTFFSFGPLKLGEGGKITDEYNGKRPGNTHYAIEEKTKLFRLRISKEQAEKIKMNSAKFAKNIDSEEIFYDASLNDTCAETARDILSASNVLTPDGHGAVIGSGNIFIDMATYNMEMVNPYMWFKNFQSAYGDPILCYGEEGKIEAQPGEEKDENGYKIKLSKSWVLSTGDTDLLAESERQIIHDDIRE